jgi:hypothetical protein
MQMLRHTGLRVCQGEQRRDQAVRYPPSGRFGELQPVGHQFGAELLTDRRLGEQQVQQPGSLAGGFGGVVGWRWIRQVSGIHTAGAAGSAGDDVGQGRLVEQ